MLVPSPSLIRLIALRVRSNALPSLQSNSTSTSTARTIRSCYPVQSSAFSSWFGNKSAENSNDVNSYHDTSGTRSSSTTDAVMVEKVKIAACGDIDSDDEDDDEMEQEEMFVEAHVSPAFEHGATEWGGPRRGGRFPEPTRFGDWERKGRCSDF